MNPSPRERARAVYKAFQSWSYGLFREPTAYEAFSAGYERAMLDVERSK